MPVPPSAADAKLPVVILANPGSGAGKVWVILAAFGALPLLMGAYLLLATTGTQRLVSAVPLLFGFFLLFVAHTARKSAQRMVGLTPKVALPEPAQRAVQEALSRYQRATSAPLRIRLVTASADLRAEAVAQFHEKSAAGALDPRGVLLLASTSQGGVALVAGAESGHAELPWQTMMVRTARFSPLKLQQSLVEAIDGLTELLAGPYPAAGRPASRGAAAMEFGP